MWFVLIGNCVYPPIKFSKQQQRLSPTCVTLWFGKHSRDCLAGVNLLLTAVTLFAHIIFFTKSFFFVFLQDETNYSFSLVFLRKKNKKVAKLLTWHHWTSHLRESTHIAKGVLLLSNVPTQGRVCNHTVAFQSESPGCDCALCPHTTEPTGSKHSG